jgi:BirA family biotin operon repressor/biotin-[acetyl-CoA-carboxylase] ligase
VTTVPGDSAARPVLRADAVLDALAAGSGHGAGPGGLWTSVEVVPSTGSTNADLLARGGPEGQVLVAEEQTAGRGRAGRTWISLPGASLTFSVLLRPASVPPAVRGWLPLLTGMAVAAAVRSVAGVQAALKWPNDVLVGDRKLAGILAEQSPAGDAVVVGVGLNVATPQDALPLSPAGLPATSLLVEGAEVDREPLLTEILRGLERLYLVFRADPDPDRSGLLAEYTAACATLGRMVRVELPAGRMLTGRAESVDRGGRLLVRPADAASATAVSAGDIVHLRLNRTPAPSVSGGCNRFTVALRLSYDPSAAGRGRHLHLRAAFARAAPGGVPGGDHRGRADDAGTGAVGWHRPHPARHRAAGTGRP